jgi:hypothetical protein
MNLFSARLTAHSVCFYLSGIPYAKDMVENNFPVRGRSAANAAGESFDSAQESLVEP